MAIISLCGWETGDGAHCLSAPGGTSSVQDSVIRSGVYAFRANPTTSATGSCTVATYSATTAVATSFSAATVYCRFYFRYATKPASGNEEFFQCIGTGSLGKVNLRLNDDGTISAYDSTTTLIATGATVLAQDTWYRIEVSSSNGTSEAFEVRVNGATEISSTGNLGAVNNVSVRFGKGNNRNNNTVDFFYDDFAASDSDWVGAGEGVILVPNANGSTMQWTSGTGSTYTEVNTIPFDNATYVMNSTSANQRAHFNFPSASESGISGTINGVIATCQGCRDNTSVTSAFRGELRTASTNYSFNSSDQNLTTTDANYSQIYGLNPNTSAAWTTAQIDAVQAGAFQVNASCQVRVAGVSIYVDFTAATSDGGGGGSFGAGAGF